MSEPQNGRGASKKEKAPTRLFDLLSAGLADGVAYARGEASLRVTTWQAPDPPPAYDAPRIRALRSALGLSQPFFSQVLNVSTKTVQGWEQGLRRPSQASARLLQLIERPELMAQMRPPARKTPSSPGRKRAKARQKSLTGA